MKWKHYYGYASEIDKRFSSSEDGVGNWNAKIWHAPIVFGALLIVIWELY
jgi:hypothetical protein